MAAPTVRFTCTTLPVNKKGELPIDEHGYYTHPVGALDALNSVGEYYTSEGARQLFESSSPFMIRVKSSTLAGECGHPKPLPNQSMDSYAERFMQIEETRISHHFSELWLDFDSVKKPDGSPQITIMAKVRPSGPYKAALEDAFNNPKMNTCFSLRGVTEDVMIKGVWNRTIRKVVTFDWVQHGGIEYAKKFYSPTLESIRETEVPINPSYFKNVIKPQVRSLATESARTHGIELFQALGWQITEDNLPQWARW